MHTYVSCICIYICPIATYHLCLTNSTCWNCPSDTATTISHRSPGTLTCTDLGVSPDSLAAPTCVCVCVCVCVCE